MGSFFALISGQTQHRSTLSLALMNSAPAFGRIWWILKRAGAFLVGRALFQESGRGLLDCTTRAIYARRKCCSGFSSGDDRGYP